MPSIEDLHSSISQSSVLKGVELGDLCQSQSPLTTIPEESSTDRSGSGSGSSRNVPSRTYSHSVYSTEPATDTMSNPETGGAVPETQCSPGLGLDGTQEEDIVDEIYPDIKRLEELNVGGLVLQNLGKRSASDACLSDSEENEKIMLRVCLSSDESESDGLESTKTAPGYYYHKKSAAAKPSLIPRARKSHSDSAYHDIPNSKKGIGESNGPEWDIGNGVDHDIFDPQTKIASDELLNSDTDESLDETEQLMNEPDPMNGNPMLITRVRHRDSIVDSADAEDPSAAEPEPTDGSPNLMTPIRSQDSQILVSVTEVDEDPFQTPKAKDLHAETVSDADSPTPRLPNLNTAEKRRAPTGSVDRSSRQIHEPKLDLIEGALVVSNPFRGDFATYKITMITEVKLQKGRIGNWSHLRVPGLPRMKSSENGWFLFQISDSVGMEFQTTSFGSHKFVEDCFLAELVQSGDLNIPLRLCPRSFYGTLGDFTVDQEIQSEHVTHKHSRKRMVVYNAICSLRLYKRCFFSERCSFYLWIDSGPEGDYDCEVDSSSVIPAFLRLPSEDRPIGVSCIHIVCSPSDLGAFCVSWCVDCHCDDGLEWVPRVFPGQITRQSHSLREVMSQLSSGFVTKTILNPLDVTRESTVARESTEASKPAKQQGRRTRSYRQWPLYMVMTLAILGLAVYPGWLNLTDVFSAFKDSAVTVIPRTEHVAPTPSESDELSWRDKLDYFLGWEGPRY